MTHRYPIDGPDREVFIDATEKTFTFQYISELEHVDFSYGEGEERNSIKDVTCDDSGE